MRRVSRFRGSSRLPAPAGESPLPPPSVHEGETLPPSGRFASRMVDLRKGDCIQPPDGGLRGLYLLRSGIVGLRRKDPCGRYVFLRLLYPGEVFCVSVAGSGFGTTAQAITPGRVTFIGGEDGDVVTEGEATVGHWLLDALQREVELTEQRIVDLATLSAREILARQLLELCRLHPSGAEPDSASFRIPMTRRELAGLIGIRPESLARLLTGFVSQGLIELSGRQARIVDRSGMRRIAGAPQDKSQLIIGKMTSVMERQRDKT